MDANARQELVDSVLRSFLREVLKDGQVDTYERAALDGLCEMLKVDSRALGPLIEEVQAGLKANPVAGSMDPMVFLRDLAQRLKGGFEKPELLGILKRIGEILEVEPDEVERAADSLFAGGSHSGSADEGKFRIRDREGVNYVEIALDNDAVRTEAGAMRYYRGLIEMESTAKGGVTGFFKAAFSGETFHKPVYRGTGLLVLEPSLMNFIALELDDEELILDQGAYFASDMEVEVSAWRNKAVAAVFSGEGWFQTSVKGRGTVIVQSPGPVEVIDLKSDRLVVDGSFAIARSSSLSFKVTRSTKSVWGSMTSGEGLVNTIEGTGRVWLAPIPNRQMMLRQMMWSAMRPAGS